MLPKIEVKNLSKIYYAHAVDALKSKSIETQKLKSADKVVLNNLSFTFNSGETIGIIGRNGAGKSTLLAILAGVAQHTSGEININGKVTAVMTLGVGLREDLTGRENIYLDGQLQGKSKVEIDEHIDEIITFSELGEFIDKPIKVYSTGMKSRLAFSMLVGIEPEILIIDEALSAGDIFFAKKASEKIKEICEKGKIVIIVSHSMATIESMCSRCLWLDQGNILIDDKPSLVTQSYLEEVRKEDELKIIENYKNVHYSAEHANYKIKNVLMKSKQNDCQQSIFYTKENLSLEIKLRRINLTRAYLTCLIERADGLIVCHESQMLDTIACDESELFFTIQLTLDSLVLNQGYFQLNIMIFEQEELTNQWIQFFEVKNNEMAKGGVPLLHYPVEIKLINEEVHICSDSIEMITG